MHQVVSTCRVLIRPRLIKTCPRVTQQAYNSSMRSTGKQDGSQKSTSLTHVDGSGQAHMVSIASKSHTHRMATARATVCMKSETLDLIRANALKKGDVLATARVAGIMAAKRTSELIPLCHNIPLSRVSIALDIDHDSEVVIVSATAETTAQTGVEMEALVACSTAALTVYDMVKAVDRHVVMKKMQVVHKSGGKSGDWTIEG